MAKRSQNAFKPQSSSPAEWVAAALGAIIVVATIAYLIYFDMAAGPVGPRISIVAQSVEQTREGYLVTFNARNSGHATAARLNVKGELLDGEKVLEFERSYV